MLTQATKNARLKLNPQNLCAALCLATAGFASTAASAGETVASAYRTQTGPTEGAWFGYSVARAGDINLDGVQDYIVGVPGRDPIATGGAIVYSGVSGNQLRIYTGSSVAEFFGMAVSGAGDVDGDGRDDLIVGVPYSFAGADVGGAANVYSGANSALLYQFAGDQNTEHLGHSVSGAGDVNADGRADLIVGSPLFDSDGETDNGRIFVYSGMDGSVLLEWAAADGANLGLAVCSLGDVNGDGYDDVATGAPGAARVYIYDVHNSSVIRSIGSNQPNSNFGWAIAAAGDMNDDGVSELLIGAPDYPVGLTTPGRAYVYDPVTGTLLFALTGVGDGDGMGYAVSAAGDVNGDDIPDVLVGSPWHDPLDEDRGRVEVFSGVDGSILQTFNADATYEDFGTAVAGLGDLDDDGMADVVIGSSHCLEDNRGSTHIFNGRSTEPSLSTAVRYDFGSNPEFVLLADLNGDDAADTILLNSVTDRMSIALNNGDGTFATPVSYSAADCPTSVAAGDIDFDGDLDLAVVASLDDRILLYRNDGNGGMVRSGALATGRRPISIVAADIDRSGRVDFAVTNRKDDNIFVFMNRGGSSSSLKSRFDSPIEFEVGDEPVHIATGDFTGDDWPDLAVVNQKSDRISILRNNRNGGFSAQKLIGTGVEPQSVTVADFNGDGKDDIAYLMKAVNQVHIRRASSSGSGSFHGATAITVGSGPRGLAPFDVNDDGHVDLAVANRYGNSLSILINNGAGSLSNQMEAATSVGPYWLATGDLDGDGDDDIINTDSATGMFSAHMNLWY